MSELMDSPWISRGWGNSGPGFGGPVGGVFMRKTAHKDNQILGVRDKTNSGIQLLTVLSVYRDVMEVGSPKQIIEKQHNEIITSFVS